MVRVPFKERIPMGRFAIWDFEPFEKGAAGGRDVAELVLDPGGGERGDVVASDRPIAHPGLSPTSLVASRRKPGTIYAARAPEPWTPAFAGERRKRGRR